MIVLGIDPGTTRIGFGVVDVSGSTVRYIESGILEVLPASLGPKHLESIRIAVRVLIEKHNPKKIGVEKLFFSKNKKTALAVAEARGVIMATIGEFSIPCEQLTPNEVKSSITGNGNADKRAVAKIVSLILNTNLGKALDDTTDALAIAIASHGKRFG